MTLVQCTICTTGFNVKPSHLIRGWGKYCSKKCQYEGQKVGKFFTCSICKKQIYRNNKDQNRSKSGEYFCSKKCQSVWRNSIEYIGARHANWINGTASYRAKMLRSDLPQICAKCDTKDSRVLAVHHKDRDRKNNVISNLVWLCHNCHYLVHHHSDESEGFLVPVA